MNTTKTPPTEAKITQSIIRYLNRLPACYARKIHGSRYNTGFPDIICVREGVALFFEVKRPGKHPTILQNIELEHWRAAGAVAMVVYDVEDVRNIME